MKITRVETITVVVPVHEGSWHSPEFIPEGYSFGGRWVRLHWPEYPIVLLKLHTDEGLVGLGEVPKGTSADEVMKSAPIFERLKLDDINLQELPLETMWFANSAVYEGYEMALYDLLGKALGVPVYRLFGGKYRDLVPVSRCSGRMNPGYAADFARKVVAEGYSVLKMKATADDPLFERLAAIQTAVGDQLGIVVDPNQRFGHPYVLFALAERLRAAGITNVICYESPFAHDNLDWYVLARQKLTTPLALHLESKRAITEAIKREACDWLNIGGALSDTHKQAAIAEGALIPTWHGSGVGLGVSEAAFTHISAACKTMTLTSDICGESLRVDDVIQQPIVIENGYARVPEGPGLGVELDDDAVERYRVR
jgi:muconate cycloisomerase